MLDHELSSTDKCSECERNRNRPFVTLGSVITWRCKLEKKENIGSMRIIPSGDSKKIGNEHYCFQYEDSIIVVDYGLAFPEDGIWN